MVSLRLRSMLWHVVLPLKRSRLELMAVDRSPGLVPSADNKLTDLTFDGSSHVQHVQDSGVEGL